MHSFLGKRLGQLCPAARLPDDLRVPKRDILDSALLHDREAACPVPGLVVSRDDPMADSRANLFLSLIMETDQLRQEPGEGLILHDLTVVVLLKLMAQVVQGFLLRRKCERSYPPLGHFFPIS
jgi:hypothetical protein